MLQAWSGEREGRGGLHIVVSWYRGIVVSSNARDVQGRLSLIFPVLGFKRVSVSWVQRAGVIAEGLLECINK